MKAKLVQQVQVETVLWARLADLVLGLASFSGCAERGVVPGRCGP